VNEKLYAQINSEAEADKSIHASAKQEFVKLEQGDKENHKIWQSLVKESMEKFSEINGLMDILAFDHDWPESFYENKMPAVLADLKKKKLLVESQDAQIVDLESQKLGVAVIVKSDGGTTYLLRDLATFIFCKQKGFTKHLYVVDNRQSHHYNQLFAILKMMNEMKEDEGIHIDYGFISFRGEALSTRKGNMVLAEDVIAQAEEKVAKIIQDKNPDLKDKAHVIKAVTKGALKYFDLSHNRHSDIEFDWDKVLDFEGDSGPYLQYAYARLASILRKANPSPGATRHPLPQGERENSKMTETEREILFKASILAEIVEDSLKDYLPNVLANYLFNFAGLLNKFYHESPVMKEEDESLRNFRLGLIVKAKEVLKTGLDLLGIEALEEM
jgi:arginyl-tRNA synthetase